jgi:hypothetical protein
MPSSDSCLYFVLSLIRHESYPRATVVGLCCCLCARSLPCAVLDVLYNFIYLFSASVVGGKHLKGEAASRHDSACVSTAAVAIGHAFCTSCRSRRAGEQTETQLSVWVIADVGEISLPCRP